MTTPAGEGAQSGAEGTQSGAGENTGANTGSTESGTQSSAQSGAETNAPVEETIPKAEAEALRERMKAADRRAAELDAQLRKLRDKDLPEQEKLKRDFEESQNQVATLQKTNNDLAIKVSFLEDNTYTWQNPKRALQLLDMGQVEIHADGTVSGLKEALKALATSDPYLLKQEAKEEVAPPASTTPGNNGGTGGSQSSSRKALTSRFPALNTRVKR